jgi:hypothetical protein
MEAIAQPKAEDARTKDPRSISVTILIDAIVHPGGDRRVVAGTNQLRRGNFMILDAMCCFHIFSQTSVNYVLIYNTIIHYIPYKTEVGQLESQLKRQNRLKVESL